MPFDYNACVCSGDPIVCDNAGGSAGSDQKVYERTHSYSREEGRADSRGNQTVLRSDRTGGMEIRYVMRFV